ncbi:Egl nine 1 [Phytophthora citrophthora]|uniref:Egl nine 1 n=1 Tax=Phytophthora citrophthora TaxID=4793 RepID=A0AAD9GB58_9STRA|nr:Egl nine 1 [Phytophthora citrophthora]
MVRSRVLQRLGGCLGRSSLSSLQSPLNARGGSNWDASVTSELVSGLLRDGYYVVRNAFPVEYLRHLRDEMELLRTSGQLYPNSTHILLNNTPEGGESTTKTLLLEKHDILETELALDSIRDQTSVPFLKDFFEQQVVFGPLRQALPNWLGLSGHMVKVQHNAGRGACFPMHFDTYGDDGKCVTAVLYLNEEWKEGDGGEIVLYPFPKPRVVVQPRFGELVLFSSQQMLHRVMPATKPRYALTAWMYHSPNPTARAESAAYYESIVNPPDSRDIAFKAMMTKVLRSPFRRHLLKLVYQDEWVQSLQESHLQTEAFEHYMTTHHQELQVIEAATTRMLGNFRAKDGGVNSDLPQTKEELMQQMKEDVYRDFVQNLQLQWF